VSFFSRFGKVPKKLMANDVNIICLLKSLWLHINHSHRRSLITLLFVMFVAAFSEVVSIGAVLPFLAVLTNPDHIFNYEFLHPIFLSFGYTTSQQLVFPISFIFGVAAIFAGAMRLTLLSMSTRLSYSMGANLSINIYRRTLHQPYETHISRNSSALITGISSKIDIVNNSVILNGLNLVISIVMLIVILCALFTINFTITLAVFGGIAFIYGLLIKLTRKKLLENSKRIAIESTQVIKSLQDGLGGIRDILLDGSQDIYCASYTKADLPLRRAQAFNHIVGNSPRYIMESLGLFLIALLAFTLVNKPGGIVEAIPLLGLMGLGAQRLLPIIQQAYAAWSGILSAQGVLIDVLGYLDQKIPETPEKNSILPFHTSLKLKDVSFSYGLRKANVIKSCNLEIKKGSCVGFIGRTGSGKSTILDVLMGLLLPTSGYLKIDNQEINNKNRRLWQKHIAHVPQSIFLTDSSIAQNIAFGQHDNEIDINRLKDVAKKAQLSDFIESLPNKYETVVGERGVQLSGGQRQRIGIARALYKKADVIILDEATSALDIDTEKTLMELIESLDHDMTIFIVAHRLTTLKHCDVIYELDNGTISNSYSYKEIMKNKGLH
jgi:ABC-type multidrug transport system fused ATPase/permease subunit